ncbi:MAG: flagellar hook-length control protein FliK [Planctomycetota bacterium]
MTQILAETYTTRSAQYSSGTARNTRLGGENGAFDDLFADKSASLDSASATEVEAGESSTADSDPNDTSGASSGSDEQTPDKSEAERTSEQGAAEQAGLSAAGPDEAVQSPEGDAESRPNTDAAAGTVDVVSTDASATAGTPVAADAPPQIAPNATPAGEAAAELSDQEQVRQLLRNAAAIDLAALARQELGEVAAPNAQQEAAERSRESVDLAKPVRYARPGPVANGALPANTVSGGEVPPDGNQPPPGLRPPVIRAESHPGDLPAGAQPGKTPTGPNGVLSASGQARHGVPSASGGADAGHRIDAAATKAVFLERLAQSDPARRGAVSAAERAVGVDRVLTASEPRMPLSRSVAIKSPEPPPPTRDAFLAPVQKGLGKMLAEGGGKLTVVLRPQELGDVRIAMETRRGAVRVSMEASTDAARRVLESGFDALRSSLEQRGVRVESMEVFSSEPDDAAGSDLGDRESPGGDRREEPGAGRHGTGHGDERDQADRNEHAGGLTEQQADRLWTELGIDAVA